MVVNNIRTPATLGLLGLVIVVFLIEAAFTGFQQALGYSVSIDTLERMGGSYYQATIQGGESWRLAAAMLLHGNLMHILFNGWALLNLGSQLERHEGARAVLVAFVVTGLTASLASALLGNREAISVGASGAVFGVLGFACVVGVRDVQEFVSQLRRNAFSILPALVISALIPNVDNVAHVAGVLTGLTLGYFYRPLRALEPVTAVASVVVLVWAVWNMLRNAFGR